MFSDFLCSTIYLGGFVVIFDILGKINTKKIKNASDLKSDLTFKALFLLNIFNKTSVIVEKGLNTVYNCINKKEYEKNVDEDGNVLWIKLDFFKENKLSKGLISYNYDEDNEICDVEYILTKYDSEEEDSDDKEEDSDDKEEDSEEGDDEDSDDKEEDSEEGDDEDSDDKKEGGDDTDVKEDNKNKMIFAYDYITKSYINMEEEKYMTI